MTKLFILTLLSAALTLGILLFSKNEPVKANSMNTTIRTPTEHRRTPDQTFLTFPEWFLVYSPEEFAAFTKDHPAHQFPFFGHIRQFWQAYGSVNKHILKRYPFNFGYHVMVLVIGGSTTVEYTMRACYENTIGRLSYLTTGKTFSDEDKFAALVAREYVDFIKVQPWYEFDFLGKLKSLWKDNPTTGKNMVRKWERRYILSFDYGVKAIYGWIIKKATKAGYEEPILSTAVLLDKPLELNTSSATLISDEQKNENDSTLILLPRYDAFKDQALDLALKSYNFIEIAGNTEDIMVSYIVPSLKEFHVGNAKILFIQPILTNPPKERVALIIPVKDLANFLRDKNLPDVSLEHIYDF